MHVLGIETSGRPGTVALMDGHRVLAERSLEQPGRRHAQTLISEILSLLKESALQPSAINLVTVSIGPGSFTGLRVGVVCAKTWSYATGCPVVGVDTFLAVAANSPDDVSNLAVIADAQREELYVGRYRRTDDGSWIRKTDIEIVKISALAETLTKTDVLTGPGLDKFAEHFPDHITKLDPEFRHPRAAVVAQLGARKLHTDGPDDFWKLEPFYLRKSAAEEKWDMQHSQ